MLDPNLEYFPDPDSPFLASFGRAFVRMMFEHAKMESRVRDLQAAITGKDHFGEDPRNQWHARERPKKMKSLMCRNNIGLIPEVADIVALLQQAITHCDLRNLLAHGIWWCFNPSTQTITVRNGTYRPDEEQHQKISVSDIEHAADCFADIEAGLYRLKDSVESQATVARAGGSRPVPYPEQ